MSQFYVNILTDDLCQTNCKKIDLSVSGKSAGEIEHIKHCTFNLKLPIELHLFRRNMIDLTDVKSILNYVEKLIDIEGLVISSIHSPELINQQQKDSLLYADMGGYTDYIEVSTLYNFNSISNFMYNEGAETDSVNLMRCILLAELITMTGLNSSTVELSSRRSLLYKLKDIYDEGESVNDYLTKMYNLKINPLIHIPVVIHCTYNLNSIINMNLSVTGNICNSLNLIFKNFKHVDLAVENVTPKMCERDTYKLNTISNPLTNAIIVSILRENMNNLKLDKSRVCTVFDYCHYLMSCHYLNGIERFPLYKVLESQKDMLRIIHLADCIGNGTGENHGVLFDSEDYWSNRRLLDFMSSFCKVFSQKQTPNIVLEIAESTYPSVFNKQQCIELLQSVCNVKSQ